MPLLRQRGRPTRPGAVLAGSSTLRGSPPGLAAPTGNVNRYGGHFARKRRPNSGTPPQLASTCRRRLPLTWGYLPRGGLMRAVLKAASTRNAHAIFRAPNPSQTCDWALGPRCSPYHGPPYGWCKQLTAWVLAPHRDKMRPIATIRWAMSGFYCRPAHSRGTGHLLRAHTPFSTTIPPGSR